MREKKSGALSRVQKLKKRLSHSFGRLCESYVRMFNNSFFHVFVITAISKEESEGVVVPYNGYSEEFLDRIEPNGNIPSNKDRFRLGGKL